MCTGALLLDKDRHVIEEHLLDKELVRDIYNHYRDYSNIIVQTESESHFYFTDFIDFPTFTMIKDFEEIKDSKFYSISLVFDTNEEAATFVSDVHDRYPMVSGYQNTNVIDIVSKGISKGTGVKAIKNILMRIRCLVLVIPIMIYLCLRQVIIVLLSIVLLIV